MERVVVLSASSPPASPPAAATSIIDWSKPLPGSPPREDPVEQLYFTQPYILEEVRQVTRTAEAECGAAQASRRADLEAEQAQIEELAAKRVEFERKMLTRETNQREAEATRRDSEARFKLQRHQRLAMELAGTSPTKAKAKQRALAAPARASSRPIDSERNPVVEQQQPALEEEAAVKRREGSILAAMQDEFQQRYSETTYARHAAHFPVGEFAAPAGHSRHQYQSSREHRLTRAFDNPNFVANTFADSHQACCDHNASSRGAFRHTRF